jgi:hypothetical protein
MAIVNLLKAHDLGIAIILKCQEFLYGEESAFDEVPRLNRGGGE